MDISITLRNSKGIHAKCTISFERFEEYANDDSLIPAYKFRELSYAVGVFKRLPAGIKDGDPAVMELDFHDIRKFPVVTSFARHLAGTYRADCAIERVRDLQKKIQPLRNKLYDMMFVVRWFSANAKNSAQLRCDKTTLSHFDVNRYEEIFDIVYAHEKLPMQNILWRNDMPYTRFCIELHIERINDRAAMLRCIKAIEQVNTRLFERYVLEIVKKFL